MSLSYDHEAAPSSFGLKGHGGHLTVERVIVDVVASDDVREPAAFRVNFFEGLERLSGFGGSRLGDDLCSRTFSFCST